MLCPNCSNSEASILSSKLDSKKILITRKRHCLICGYKFETVEYPKKKIKKRKIEKRTEWQNFRFTFYIAVRFSHVMAAMGGPELKRFKNAANMDVIKENRKLKVIIYEIKNGKLVKEKFQLPTRPQTISMMLNWPDSEYWKKREFYYPDRPKEDQNIKETVKVEVDDFVKSVINYIGHDKYNREFVTSCIKSNVLGLQDRKNETINPELLSDKFWNFWKKIR